MAALQEMNLLKSCSGLIGLEVLPFSEAPMIKRIGWFKPPILVYSINLIEINNLVVVNCDDIFNLCCAIINIDDCFIVGDCFNGFSFNFEHYNSPFSSILGHLSTPI